MANFDFLVDTEPMANTVSSVSQHVLGTTAAVATMQTAVIQTEKEAADYICSNVDKGFFSLIRSQITTKLAKYFTDMNASTILLAEFSKSLANTQNRMENDVNRIKRDFYKIFHGLDKSLENRISQINKDAIFLSSLRTDSVINPLRRSISSVYFSTNDSQLVEQGIITARLNNKTSKALDCLGGNAIDNDSFKNQLTNLLEQKQVNSSQKVYVPVVYIKCESQATPGINVEEVFMPNYIEKSSKDSIQINTLSNAESIFSKQKTEFEYGEIKKKYNEMINNTEMDERVAQTMSSLFDNGGVR